MTGAEVRIGTATMADVDTLADLWVSLAAGQRDYRSHVVPEGNREAVADALARSVVSGGLFVARTSVDLDDAAAPGATDAVDDAAAVPEEVAVTTVVDPETDGLAGGGAVEAAGRSAGAGRDDRADRGADAARGAGAVAGFVMFGLASGTYRQDRSLGQVHNLYVRPALRGRGVGTALLRAAEASLAAAGADSASLEAMVDNEGAVRFYERHGYRPHRVELEKPLTDEDG